MAKTNIFRKIERGPLSAAAARESRAGLRGENLLFRTSASKQMGGKCRGRTKGVRKDRTRQNLDSGVMNAVGKGKAYGRWS